jgi:hypothetical protein
VVTKYAEWVSSSSESPIIQAPLPVDRRIYRNAGIGFIIGRVILENKPIVTGHRFLH